MENIVLQTETLSGDDYLLQKRLEIMLEANNKKVFSELNNIKAMLGKLNDDISLIRGNLNESRISITKESSRCADDERKIEPVKVETAKAEEQRNNREGNLTNKQAANAQAIRPRYGDYKPEDVAVDKFFYFGNKKK